MKIWKKFHKISNDTLRVSLENSFLPEEALGIDQRYMENGLIYKNHFIQKVYEPALEIVKSDGAVQVIFEPIIFPAPRYRMLQFSCKLAASNWIIASRFGEEKVFGFDAKDSWDRNYFRLAYPGLSGSFIPVYFKTLAGNEVVYFEVWAWDEDKKIVVQCRRVSEEEVPDILVSAKPAAVAA
ncbi:MAG: hypothetical protein AAB772_00960 [Patescibacteria group bacterium]